MKDAGLIEVAVVLDPFNSTDFTEFEAILWRPIAEGAEASGVITSNEAAEWLQDLREHSERERFFAASIAFVARGRRHP
jgi:hypothetical protein